MADKPIPNTQLVTSSQVLRDYLYGRLRSGACLSLTDKLLGLVMLSRESARVYAQASGTPGEPAISPHLIGHLKGYLLSNSGNAQDIPVDICLNGLPDDPLRGKITKLKT